MGTAGLLTPGENPGSYFFLTLVQPASRQGVVAGWLTADRGSGVLFSEIAGNVVRFNPRIDYGHLRLEPGDSGKQGTLAIGRCHDALLGEELLAAALAR